jgi:acetylornithine/N-succinyldiaminopimelate aminotransferase
VRGGFHGRTIGALAATANPHYKEGFEPLPGGFAYTPFNDVAALERAIDDTSPRSSSSPCKARAA